MYNDDSMSRIMYDFNKFRDTVLIGDRVTWGERSYEGTVTRVFLEEVEIREIGGEIVKIKKNYSSPYVILSYNMTRFEQDEEKENKGMSSIEDDIRYYLGRGALKPSTLLAVLEERGWKRADIQEGMRREMDAGVVGLNINMEFELV